MNKHLVLQTGMTSSGPEVNLEFLTMRKEVVAVPKGMHTPMCYCDENCKLVKCKVLGYVYGMRLFMCLDYEHDPIKPFVNVRPKVRNKLQYIIIHVIASSLLANLSLKRLHLLSVILCSG